MADSLRDQKARDLADQVTEAVRKRRDGRDGKDGQIIVQTNDTDVRALKEEIATLKAQALVPKNDEQAIPLAIGRIGEELQDMKRDFSDVRQQLADQLADIHRRITQLEQRPTEIISSEPAELQDEINDLGRELASISAAILQRIVTLQKRADAQDARFAELPTVLAQLQKERRAAG